MIEENEKLKVKKDLQVVWIAKAIIFISSFLSMLFSIYLFYNKDTDHGLFVGLWVPSILSAGALLFAGKNEH